MEVEGQGGAEKLGIGLLDVLRILGGLLLLNCAASWFITNESVAWGYRPWWSRPAQLKAYMVGTTVTYTGDLSIRNGARPFVTLQMR